MADLTDALFHSRTRAALLRLLFERKVSASMRGLARLARLSTHAVTAEVKNLAKAGLVKVESVGAADLVSANLDHPAVQPLLDLLRVADSLTVKDDGEDVTLRESLTAYGAPLMGCKPQRTLTLEEALVQGLRAAKQDGTLLKVLPVVLAKNARTVDWVVLRETARRNKLGAELGMLVELTANASNRPEMKKETRGLEDRRRSVMAYFTEPRNRFERELVESATPPAARKWHFLVNVGEDTLRDTVRKHLG